MTGQNITNTKGTLLFSEIAISNENEHSEGDIIPNEKSSDFTKKAAPTSVKTVSPGNHKSILDLKVKNGYTLMTDF